MKRVLLIIALMLAASCETMSADDCATADWRSLGYQDGADGQTLEKLSQRSKSCQTHGYSPDVPAYNQGRESGLANFCRPENGYDVGLSGHKYEGVCSAFDEGAFLSEYRDGYERYRVKKNVEDARSRVSSLETSLRNLQRELREIDYWFEDNAQHQGSDTYRSDAAGKRNKQRKLREELDDCYDDLRRAEDDLFRAERELDNFSYRDDRQRY